MKVKICGITCEDDATTCEVLGSDMLGFVHYPGKIRSLSIEKIAGICSVLGPSVTKVLVCNPQDVASALDMFEKSGVDSLQLCSLDPDATEKIRQTGVNVMRAVKPVKAEAERFANSVDCLVYEGGEPGTGAVYDYSSIPLGTCSKELIAGGLGPENIQRVVALKPYGVDVSSGVEISPGRKDPFKVAAFIRRCREQ